MVEHDDRPPPTANRVVWHWSKHALETARSPDDDDGARMAMSRDVNGKTGCKQFADFPTVDAAVAYASARPGAPLYEILEDCNAPKFVFFDIDRNDTEFTTAAVVEQALDAVATYITGNCDHAFEPVVGVNAQVCTASTATKTSAHIRLDLEVVDMLAHKALANRISELIMEDVTRWPALVGMRAKYGGEPKPTCVIDATIYTSYRSFRILGAVKILRDNPLVPFGASSHDITDHLIERRAGDRRVPRIKVPSTTAWSPARRRGGPRAAVGPAPTGAAAEYAAIINSWGSTEEVFGGPVAICHATAGWGRGTVMLRCARGTVCPYAKRIHASNYNYLEYNEHAGVVRVVCFDEECCNVSSSADAISIRRAAVPGDPAVEADLVNIHTLHTQERSIPWDDVYDEPTMRDYPSRHVVVVRAGMGAGKTKAAVRVINTICTPDSKVLFVFSNRSLPGKIKAMLDAETSLKFVNYLDVVGDITANCVLCCLDSLPRVRTANFDLVVVDEAASVLMHLNSAVMRRTSEVLRTFELFLRQSRVLFMDAVCDSSFVRGVVDFVGRVKTEAPYWIWNQYKRPTNRKATVVTTAAGTPLSVSKHSMLFAALSKLLELLSAGKRVVVASSLKSFTTTAQKAIARLLPGLNVLVFNSDHRADVSDVDGTWSKVPCVIFSPTITAGVSCEVDHFDCLLAFFVNSGHTPNVESCLQMLYRARILRDGDMFVFLTNQPPAAPLPDTVEEVRELLLGDMHFVRKMCGDQAINFVADFTSCDDVVRYDETRLSFLIIVNIVTTQNKSRNHFQELLVSTLETDYGVPCTVTQLALEPKYEYDLDVELCKEVATPDAPPPFEDVPRLTDAQHEAIVTSSDATVLQRAAALLYRYMRSWGVPGDRVDKPFYLTYAVAKDADAKFFKAKRAMTRATVPLAQSRALFAERVTDILGGGGADGDGNMDMFKSGALPHFLKLIVAQELLEDVFAGDVGSLVDIGRLTTVKVELCSIEQGVQAFKGRLQSGEREISNNWRACSKVFDIKTGELALVTFRKVCREAFGIKVKRVDENSTRAGYYWFKLISETASMLDKYAPALLLQSRPRMG